MKFKFQQLSKKAQNRLIYEAVFEVHRDLASLHKKVDLIMAQDQELMDLLTTISSDVDSTVTQLGSLQSQLQEINANTPAEVDLQPAIDLASSIKARLENTAQTATAAATPDNQQSPSDTTTVSDSAQAGSTDSTSAGDTTSSSTGGSDLGSGAVGTPTDSTVTPPDEQSNPA